MNINLFSLVNKLSLSIGISSLVVLAHNIKPVLADGATVGPLVIETNLQQGQARGTITVTNSSNETFRARISADDFTYDNEGLKNIPSHAKSVLPYLQFSPKELEVPPGVTRTIRLNAVLPPSVKEGEYRGVIFTEDLKEKKIVSANGSTTTVKTRIGSLFFVRKGDFKPELSIARATWDRQDKKIKVLFKNNGQASAYPTTEWTVKRNGNNLFSGKIAGTVVLLENERVDQIKISEENLSKLTPGSYELSGKIIVGQDKNKKEIPFTTNFSVNQ